MVRWMAAAQQERKGKTSDKENISDSPENKKFDETDGTRRKGETEVYRVMM